MSADSPVKVATAADNVGRYFAKAWRLLSLSQNWLDDIIIM